MLQHLIAILHHVVNRLLNFLTAETTVPAGCKMALHLTPLLLGALAILKKEDLLIRHML
jgi:hypothetical protein